MKEVKEEIQRVETRIHYEAVDGTEFKTQEECAEYEASARGVLRGRLKEFIVNDRYNCWDLLGGDEEHQCLAIVVPTEEAKYVILQNYYLDQAWILKPDNSRYKERVDNAVQKAYENNDIILFGLNCDDNLYLIDTRMSIIDRLTNLDKKDDSER